MIKVSEKKNPDQQRLFCQSGFFSMFSNLLGEITGIQWEAVFQYNNYTAIAVLNTIFIYYSDLCHNFSVNFAQHGFIETIFVLKSSINKGSHYKL